ncbi:Hypothetical protein, putative [Bodo saltans]|uniref:Uncharacterized protein n=1 Tax=Bodo saltans TaxID=75058 RepID=A0A0S4IHW7_BODSA|nr:Hypothetical protein, putative [Bodo saltans]|eukprot:CUE69803.1 Hypothetical protein, putative [Bodo saltans]
MSLSLASHRLRHVAQRAAAVLPLPPPSTVTVPSTVSPSSSISGANDSEVEHWDMIRWNHSVVQLLQSVSFVGGLSPSHWGRLKIRCLQHLSSMTPKTALACLQTFSRFRVCGKTEAMRLQEIIASGYHESISISNKVQILLTLCTLRVRLSAALKPHILSSLVMIVQQCAPHLLPRVVFAIFSLIGEHVPADVIIAIISRAGSASMKELTAADRVYLLWTVDLVVSASAHTVPLHVQGFQTWLRQSLGLVDRSSVPVHVQQYLLPEPLSLDVLLGKTRPSWQLQPKDVTLLLHTLCRFIGSTTGGTSKIGSRYFDRNRQHLRRQTGGKGDESENTSLVDGSLLSSLETGGGDNNSSTSVGETKAHFDALCHRMTLSLLCCEFTGLNTACQTLRALTQCGAAYWSTQAQILVHLLIRYVLFQYRDAVFFTHQDATPHDEDDALNGFVMLREVPHLSANEHTRLVQLRLTTSLETLEVMKLRLRKHLTVDQLTTLMRVLCAMEDIFGYSQAAAESVSGRAPITFASYYKALLAVKMQRALQIATPTELPHLVIAACKSGSLTSVAVAMCVQRLALDPDGVPGRSVRESCLALNNYAVRHSNELWSTPEPPAHILTSLASVVSSEDVETSSILVAICEACAKSTQHDELEQKWLIVCRRRGPDAPQPSELRTVLRIMAKFHLRHFGLRTALQAVAPRLIRRACHGAPLPVLLDTLISAHLVGVAPRAIMPMAENALNMLSHYESDDLSPVVDRWLRLCGMLGCISLWSSTPLAAKEALGVSVGGSAVRSLSFLSSCFLVGEDTPRLMVQALRAMESQPGEGTHAPLVASTVLMSWRGSRVAARNICMWGSPTILAALMQVQSMSEAERNPHVLWLAAAAATIVLEECSSAGVFTDEMQCKNLRDELVRCARLLCGTGDARASFSLTKVTALVNEQPGATDPSLRHVVHPCAMCGLIAQVMQSQSQDDSTKLFGAQLWRQCVKAMEKLGTTFSAASSVSSNSDSAESPLTHLSPTSVEDHMYEGVVLMNLIGLMVRCGASSQSLDLLAQKWMRRSPTAVDLVGVGTIAEGLVASGKRRPALTEFVAYCIEECSGDGAGKLACVPSHLLAAMVLMTQRDGDRVTITLGRADVVNSVLWSALEQRLDRLHPTTILELVPYCVPQSLDVLCEVIASCVVPVALMEDLVKMFDAVQQLGATSTDILKLEAAISKRTAELA